MGGIGSIIGALAVLGGMLFLAGVGLVVVSASQGRPVRNGIMLSVVGLVFFLILSVVSNGILVVQPQQGAVIFNVLNGDLEDPPRFAGTHIIIPVMQEYTIYPLSQQEYTMASPEEAAGVRVGDDAVLARSFDGQEIQVDVTVIFRLDPTELNQVHRDWPAGYLETFIRPTVRSIVRDVVSGFQAENIYAGGRDALQQQIFERVEAAFSLQRGFILTNVLVRNITFAPQFADAIERKQIEQQELQRAITEAERVRTQAEGRANAAIEAARGEAAAILLRAQAEAEALRLVSEQIAANPNLIPYLYVQNLTDQVQIAIIPSNSPFLFDLDSFMSMGEGFVPPPVPELTLPSGTGSSVGEDDN